MKSRWSEEQHVMSYNSWLRAMADTQQEQLLKNMVRLRGQLPVLESVILAEAISMERLERVSVAINHLMAEMHLLVTLTGDK